MKIRSDGAKLTYCMRRNRQTDMKKLIGAILKFERLPKCGTDFNMMFLFHN
jgi:hypothetical protein